VLTAYDDVVRKLQTAPVVSDPDTDPDEQWWRRFYRRNPPPGGTG